MKKKPLAALVTAVIGGALVLAPAASADTTSSIAVGSSPLGVAVSPDGGRVYVSNSGDNTLSVIDAVTGTVVDTISVSGAPQGLTVSPGGATLYVVEHTTNAVAVIDTATDTITTTIPVGPIPDAIAVSPDGTRAYVANEGNNTLSVIETATNTVTTTVVVGGDPSSVVVSPDSGTVYVSNWSPGSISVIRASDDTVTSTIGPIPGNRAYGLALSPDGGALYVADTSAGMVSVVDTGVPAITSTIAVGGGPFFLAPSPDGSKLYVANNGDNTISVVDTTTGTVSTTIPVESGPQQIAVRPNGSRIYVVNGVSNSLSVVVPTPYPLISTTSLAGGTVGKAYAAVVSAGGTPAPTFSIASGALPAGLHLASGGAITGTPTVSGTFTVAVKASNTVGGLAAFDERSFAITIAKAAVVPPPTPVKKPAAPARTITLNAKLSHGAYVVRNGHHYTITVLSKQRPRYVNAAPSPHKPHGLSVRFNRKGTKAGLPRWQMTVWVSRSWVYEDWNLGVKIGSTTHKVKVHVT